MAAAKQRMPNPEFRAQRLEWGNQRQAADHLNAVAHELGINLACTEQQIRRLESGASRWPNLDYVRVLTHATGRSMEDLGFPARRDRRAAHPPQAQTSRRSEQPSTEQGDDVDRRRFLTAAAAASVEAFTPVALVTPTSVDAAHDPVSQLADVVRRLRCTDQSSGAGAVYPEAARWLRTAYRMLNDASFRGTTEQRLQVAAGELAVSVGWFAHDVGLLSDARTFYTEAQAAARLADDRGLEVHALCNLSSLACVSGRPREALRLAEAAQRVAAPVATGWLTALLGLREAQAWAALGERAPTQRALVRANRAFESGPNEDDPEWMAFFGIGQMSSLEAACWSSLGKHATAAVMVEKAAAVAGERFVRDRAMHHTRAAHEYLTAGDRDAADGQLAQVLPLLPKVSSTRLAMTLRDLATRTPTADHESVRDYLELQVPPAVAL